VTDSSGPLRNRRFLTVLSGQGLSMLGDAAFDIALAWLVISETGSVSALAGILLMQAIPRGALLLLGGAVTDRLAPRAVMLVCHVLRAAGMAAAAFLVITGGWHLWHLYALSLLMGVAGAFFTPAAESVLPHVLASEHYARGNALQGFAEQLSLLVGPMVGGALTAASGAGAAIAVNAATFAAAALTCLAVPPVEADNHPADDKPATILRQIGDGLQHAWRSHDMRLVLLIVSAATLSYSGLFAIGLPALANAVSPSPLGLSVLVSAWGAGQLIGTLAAAITGLPQRWGLLIIGMTLAEGVAFTLLGHAPNVWVAAALLLPLGVGVAYSADVALPTFIQTRTPKNLLGRMSSLLALPRTVLEPVSIAVLSVVLNRSIAWGFAAAAVPVLVAGALLALDPRARGLSTRPARTA
jgi:MFS family permease